MPAGGRWEGEELRQDREVPEALVGTTSRHSLDTSNDFPQKSFASRSYGTEGVFEKEILSRPQWYWQHERHTKATTRQGK